MARLVMVLGRTGTGKSTSLRNFTAKDVNVISVLGKELPFKTDIKPYHPKTYRDVLVAIEKASKPVVVVDDTNYLMSLFEFATINETGYAKFARNAESMVRIFNAILEKDSDQTFYVFAHSENTEDGHLAFKTTGKMVSEKYTPEGATNIVLEAAMDDATDEFIFRVKANGSGVKSPLGMFDTPTVPNDLKAVNETIKKYYGGTK